MGDTAVNEIDILTKLKFSGWDFGWYDEKCAAVKNKN
jgi:hypothetical protein